MYFFYFDESGSRDPSIGTAEKPKDHIYVLLAVGMYENKWKRFEREISQIKQRLAKRRFNLAECEVKSNWIRHAKNPDRTNPFLHSLSENELNSLTATYYRQLSDCNAVIMAAVIDKRCLEPHTTHEILHKKAYEFLLERIQHYMRENHPKHNALIVMDDTNKQLNQAVAMKHAFFQQNGNQNMAFPSIVEYPFFTRSELSNGVQLADLLAYNVYHAFKANDFNYPYFQKILPHFYRGTTSTKLDGLKIWPNGSQLAKNIPDFYEIATKKAPDEAL